MSNLISNKINEIFSDELNYKRNSNLIKQSKSNKLIRNKFQKDQNKNYELIKQFNKRQSEEDYHKEKMKFFNENNDNDISIKNRNEQIIKDENTIKKYIKKDSKKNLLKYLDNENDYIISANKISKFRVNSFNPRNKNEFEPCFKGIIGKDFKKIKKTKFILEGKKKEENKTIENKLKKKKSNSKNNIKGVVMVEKQKYPKKQTVFDRIKGIIKESNNEIENEEEMDKKSKFKKKVSLKTKKLFDKSIKLFDSNQKMRNTTRTKNQAINNIKDSERKIIGENDSSNFLKLNMDLVNNDSSFSNSKTIKSKRTNKSKNKKNLKIDNKNSENDFFQSSQFSNESNSKNESNLIANNKGDIFLTKKSSQNIKIVKNDKNSKKRKSGSPKIITKNYNNIYFYDNKSIKNSSDLSNSDSNSEDNNSDSKNSESNKRKNLDNDNSINKKFQYKYNHGEGVLSIIPEQENQDNKKLFYGDINQNIETIKPENIITLEQNITKNRSISRNLELKKNNIIINNNVSNNITVHKKESVSKKEESQKKEEFNKSNNEQKRKGKSYKIKVRKKFPFCCL